MTRQFHARARTVQKPRDPRPQTLSFKCFRLLGPDSCEIIELCETRNAMRAFQFER